MTTPAAATWKEHAYTSTACHHERHDDCRLTCKFCPSSCSCRCHGGNSPTSQRCDSNIMGSHTRHQCVKERDHDGPHANQSGLAMWGNGGMPTGWGQ